MNILLHICCGNCAIYPVKILRQQHHDVTGYFFNNNIHPYLEFKKRLETTQQYAEQVNLPLIVRNEYPLEAFLSHVATAPEQRCRYCYRSRLEETARAAADGGYEAFSTTLLYSRYQNHDEIIETGQDLARIFQLTFHYEDYRVGWQEGIRISKEMNLYRQQYCGCIYSEKDRYHPGTH
ncbi:MAG: hypothetical protein C0618_05445 [Desulfuromonas sp.]|nr:MAG: hypothetical protein C0618_05445 [Desulfuromonas sp.]